MPIHYSLFENHLTADPNDYAANVSPTRIAEMNEVIDRMIERGSTVTKADIISVMEEFESTLQVMLTEGVNINLPFANFSTSIKGVFDGPSDSYDPSRHKVFARLAPGKTLKSYFETNVNVTKDETYVPSPRILDFIDMVTGERNSVVTPGSMGRIQGSKLKYDVDNNDEGIFFVAADNNEIKVNIVGKNKPGELIFMIPDTLTSGDYKLEVRAKFGESLRIGLLTDLITVT